MDVKITDAVQGDKIVKKQKEAWEGKKGYSSSEFQR